MKISLKKSILFFSLAFVVIATGCKKDDKETVCDLNATNMVGSYKLSSVLFNGTEVINDPTFFEACSRDDIFTFVSGGTYTITEGQTACATPTNETGNWTLTGTTLDLDGEAGQVSAFSCTGFTYTMSYTDPTPFTLVFKFNKQ